jgi:hypothetical protein
VWISPRTPGLDLFDCTRWNPYDIELSRRTQSNLINIIRRNKLHGEEALWLTNTLSELCSEELLSKDEPLWIEICLAILLEDATKWRLVDTPDIVLLEAVVTLAAISCSPDKANVLTSSLEHPWLLLNIRNPGLISTWFKGTPSGYHKQLISLLFLVIYALIHRGSYPLAIQYFTIITTKSDLPLYASALTAIAPSMSNGGLSTIGRMLLAPLTQQLPSTISGLGLSRDLIVQEVLFIEYDHQLGATVNPDPNILVILLMLSSRLSLYKVQRLQNLNLALVNPWLRLVARVVAQLDIADGSGLPIGSFHDYRIHNMIAALSLLRYAQGKVTQFTESLLLASFLQSRELAISSVALEYYMKTTISYPDPLAPSSYLSRAVRDVFNLMLPDHQLGIGWAILEIFVNGFEDLPIEWRQTFAEGFFTLSRQPLPRSPGYRMTSTQEFALRSILTWEYFHENDREVESTDLVFSGLDWMAIAWSLHLLRRFGRKMEGSGLGKVQTRNESAPAVNEEFVLGALCKLLDAAPYYQIIPIISKLREFVRWFDDTELPEYRSMISALIEEAIRRHRAFRKFHCSLRV